MTIQIELIIGGDLHGRLIDVSRIESFENGICRIHEESGREDGSTYLRRSITIQQKYIRGDQTADLPSTFEALEAALQVALAFTA
jgi:hypothetical protein